MSIHEMTEHQCLELLIERDPEDWPACVTPNPIFFVVLDRV
jgi:hypothetical protein